MTKSAILSRKVQLIQFLAIFFLRFFSCRHRSTCARVATRVIFTARWRRDKFRKNRITNPSKKSLMWPRLNILNILYSLLTARINKISLYAGSYPIQRSLVPVKLTAVYFFQDSFSPSVATVYRCTHIIQSHLLPRHKTKKVALG